MTPTEEATRTADAERDETPNDERERRQLEETWKEPGGFFGWFRCVHHTTIGRRFIITAFIFFLLGGVEAVMIRIQLARPENRFLGPDLYNQIFTMHGSTMMFLFAVPVMEALGVYLVPLMVGTRNIAFPRLNAFGYYVYLFGGIFLYTMFLLNTGPDNGWFNYVPLSGPEYAPGKRSDTWAQMITFTELSALVVAVELIVTIFKLRAPGMSLNRIPLFVWAILVISFMIIFAMPTIALASTCLILDRLITTQFFNPAEGGDVLLWQHLFWFFGHPEVYILILPAFGMMSEIVPVFAGKRIFGYPFVVASGLFIAFYSMLVWAHHMFTAGMGFIPDVFFGATSMVIAIPT
ncbi:MAG TPA: cbb3-type cytochrome c oxidase subunit I, partial [Blastocatellia bacterium]|nr:cbb3-type cytochrome c oxidase subunit I [Blastocatellia bacterium]